MGDLDVFRDIDWRGVCSIELVYTAEGWYGVELVVT